MEEIANNVDQEPVIEAAAGGKRLKPGGKRPLAIVGIVLGVLILAYLGLCFTAAGSAVFFPHSAIHGVEVAGLSVEEATEKLALELPRHRCDIYLYTGQDAPAPEDREPDASVTFAALGVAPDNGWEDEVNASFILQHGKGLFSTGQAYLRALLGKDTAPQGALLCDPDRLDRVVEDLLLELNMDPQDTAYQLSADAIQLTAARDGRQVSRHDLLPAIQNAVKHSSHTAEVVELPAETLPAETLTAQEIHDTLAPEARNAGYDAATGTITPEQIGGTFDVAAAQAALDAAAPGETVTIPAQIDLPEVTAADLEAVLFRDVLGECTTPVSGSAGRVSNVRLSAAAFHGLVLNDGETLSYNATTGRRTAEKGYQSAPAYLNGETVNEIGGGVCQTSSTLYLACLRSNLKIVERHAHRYTPAYIPWGMDATVSWGGPDFQFANDTGYPIKIETAYADGKLTVRILGTNADGTTVKITAETLSKTPWKTVYQDDPALAPGAEIVKVTPYGGAVVKSYRNVYDGDGKLVSSRLEAESHYKVRDQVIARGPTQPAPPAEGSTVMPETPEAPPANEPGSLPAEDEGTILLPEEPI